VSSVSIEEAATHDGMRTGSNNDLDLVIEELTMGCETLLVRLASVVLSGLYEPQHLVTVLKRCCM